MKESNTLNIAGIFILLSTMEENPAIPMQTAIHDGMNLLYVKPMINKINMMIETTRNPFFFVTFIRYRLSELSYLV
jgi:hypothetical protein